MINKRLLKDRELEYVLITYQGEDDKDGTAIFYVGNKKENKDSKEQTEIGAIRWDNKLKRYTFRREGSIGFDAQCVGNINEFLGELNK